MNVKEFINKLNEAAPFELAESWDNPGLMTGDLNLKVNKVAVCLDAVEEAVIKAAKDNFEILLCHHPVIFRAIKKIDFETEQGRVLRAAIKNNIAVIAAHTNWDIVEGGVNTELAKLISLNNIRALDLESGLGACGVLSGALDYKEFLNRVK
ncbi:MAG: Nif3-like dinuclear metal center hexameric protein, partial [Synergistaceae bacterium]|nr:Nif3-like dinuclear metal center hexameric protein [Synergistaceae bacterium]